MVAPPAKPATPTGPATSVGTHTVTWTAVSGATHYQVQSRQDEGSWTHHPRQATLSKNFSGLAQGEWDYQVRACNLGGDQCGPWSGTLTITVDIPAPDGLTVTPTTSTDGNYTVRWNAPAYSAITLRLWQQVEKNGKKAAWTVVGTYRGHHYLQSFQPRRDPGHLLLQG